MTYTKGKKQNDTLNLLKGVACFLIVWMHCNAGTMVDSVIACAARFGIPIFFMVSGFFAYRISTDNYSKVLCKKIVHIIKYIIIASIVYVLWYWIIYPIINGLKPQSFSQYFAPLFTKKRLFDLLVLNVNPFSGTLWFLNALLYCYLIWLLLSKINNKKIIYVVALIVLFGGIVLRGFIQIKHLIPEEVNINYFRNWLFLGLPFYIIGYAINENKERIIKISSEKQLLLVAGLGLVVSFAERLLVPLEVFFGTVVVTIALFVFAIKKPNVKKIPIINKVGERFCFAIYIMHPIVRDGIDRALSKTSIGGNKLVLFINPIIVFLICFLISILIYQIIDLIIKKEEYEQ